MKATVTFMLISMLGGLLLPGCSDDNPSCPVEPIDLHGPQIPATGHVYPKLSPDARQLAYIEEGAGRIKVLDLATGIGSASNNV